MPKRRDHCTEEVRMTKVLREGFERQLAFPELCGSRRLEGDREIKLLVNQGRYIYKY